MTEMTLHEAMATVLREHGGWMTRDVLAREIATRGLYRRRAGGAAPSDQLRLRARKYAHLFEGSDHAFTRIRLAATPSARRNASEPRAASGNGAQRPPGWRLRCRRQRARRRRRTPP